MNPQLSVILPVHNAQADLAHRVRELLEVLPELTPHFDLLVVDDGSADATEEVAHELALQYPQVRLARHATRRGLAAAVATGLEATRGEAVLVSTLEEPLRASTLRALWQLHEEGDLVLASAAPVPPRQQQLLARLMEWAAAVASGRRQAPRRMGMHLLRRDLLRQLQEQLDAPHAAPVRLDGAAAAAGKRRPSFAARLRRFAASE